MSQRGLYVRDVGHTEFYILVGIERCSQRDGLHHSDRQITWTISENRLQRHGLIIPQFEMQDIYLVSDRAA